MPTRSGMRRQPTRLRTGGNARCRLGDSARLHRHERRLTRFLNKKSVSPAISSMRPTIDVAGTTANGESSPMASRAATRLLTPALLKKLTSVRSMTRAAGLPARTSKMACLKAGQVSKSISPAAESTVTSPSVSTSVLIEPSVSTIAHMATSTRRARAVGRCAPCWTSWASKALQALAIAASVGRSTRTARATSSKASAGSKSS